MIRLEDHLKEVKREIKHRCEENIRLQHEVLEKSSALQQYSARVSQLEQSESVQRSAVRYYMIVRYCILQLEGVKHSLLWNCLIVLIMTTFNDSLYLTTRIMIAFCDTNTT